MRKKNMGSNNQIELSRRTFLKQSCLGAAAVLMSHAVPVVMAAESTTPVIQGGDPVSEPVSAVISGVPILVFANKPGAPVVFVAHGRGGQASDVAEYCRDLVKAGMTAIAVDQRNHGKRLVDPAANEGWSRTHAADMYSNFVGTALDISLLIDLVPARLGIAVDKIGMTGISLGGHATLAAMRLEPRIAVGAAMIGSGDYRQLMELRAKQNNVPPEQFGEYFHPALEQAVRKYDPIHHPEYFADRPLLMTNGLADDLVQPQCNQSFERALRPHYRHQERLKLSLYPEVGHEVPDAMWQEVLAWLKQWLVG